MLHNMNACIIAYTFYEVDQRVKRYAETLAESGNRVDVFVLKKADEKKRDVLNKVNIHRIQRRSYKEKTPLGYLMRFILFFLKGTILLIFKHCRYRYKIIHINNIPDFFIFMGFIPKFMGAKLILDIHDILPEFFCQKFSTRFDSKFTNYLLFMEKLSTQFADHVIVANDLWRYKIILRDRVSFNKCTTLLNYPDKKIFFAPKYRNNKSQFKLIYTGTLSDHHGIDIAVRAVNIVRKQEIPIRFDLYFVSNNLQDKNSLQVLIDELGLRKIVKLFEPVPHYQLGKILAQADVGIVPKRGGIFANEAFSTKILEFMAAGIPVIASNTKIDKFYFDDSMIKFFLPENHKDLARCIIELYKNPNERQSLVNFGKKFIEDNNWDNKKYLYHNIIGKLETENI